MKILKKISVILMAVGVFIIFGKMGESDFYTVSVLETLSGVLSGGAVMSFGKALYEVCRVSEKGRQRCKKIPFSGRKNPSLGASCKRAV